MFFTLLLSFAKPKVTKTPYLIKKSITNRGVHNFGKCTKSIQKKYLLTYHLALLIVYSWHILQQHYCRNRDCNSWPKIRVFFVVKQKPK